MQSQIAGVDFSGARDVPNQTWLAVGRLDSIGLEIIELRQTGSHKLPGELAALPQLKAIGLDFPFSLPADFLRFCAERSAHAPFQSWQEVVEHLVFVTFDDFLALVKEFEKESKRLTDLEYRAIAKSPMHRGAPSMVQMTYQGMRLLAGLDPSRFAVLPFQDAGAGRVCVLEVFPRATLWSLSLPDSGYKGKEKKDRDKVEAVRRDLLTQLLQLRERKGAICKDYPRLTVGKSLQHVVVESADALDALVACYTTAIWAVAPALFADPFSVDNEDVLLEGWIYAPTSSRPVKV